MALTILGLSKFQAKKDIDIIRKLSISIGTISMFCQEHLQKRLYYILANGYAGPFENRFTVRFWFEPLFIAEIGDTSVVFDAPDQMVADWVKENYIGLLTSALKTAGISGRSIVIKTQVRLS